MQTEDDTIAQLVREVRALRAEVTLVKHVVTATREDLDKQTAEVRALRAEVALVKRVVITVREDLDNERRRLDKEIGYIGQIVRALRAEEFAREPRRYLDPRGPR